MEFIIAAVAAACAAITACRLSTVAESSLGQSFCPSFMLSSKVHELSARLSSTARVLLPGDAEFGPASQHWSALIQPKSDIVVIPGAASDVAETVKYANKHKKPFLAVSGGHGMTRSLDKMQGGIKILMRSLDSIQLAEDGHSAKVGGGALAKQVIDALWDAGKQTGPGLGGGHGWLQGHHGLIADQFISMDVVLADGSERTIDARSDPDLWWAMRGAGHNFAIVTSVTLKTFELEHRDWGCEVLFFAGTQVEAVFEILQDIISHGKQEAGLLIFSFIHMVPDLDKAKPVISVYFMKEGVKEIESKHTAALRRLGPLHTRKEPRSYKDLSSWVMITEHDEVCQKKNINTQLFSLYLKAYDAAAMRKVYNMFVDALDAVPEMAAGSMLLFENYAMQGVHRVASNDSAFAFRDHNTLSALYFRYAASEVEQSGGGRSAQQVEGEVAAAGEAMRRTLHEASGHDSIRAYVNYAMQETREAVYGDSGWRLEKLRAVKAKYDAFNRFRFYNPVI